jgi:Flp pilus assembly protein TadB
VADYVPFGTQPEKPQPLPRPGSSTTLPIWLLSVGSVLEVILVLSALAQPVLAVLAVLVLGGVNVIVAMWDSRMLADRGYFVAVPAGWAAIPVVYLWRRCAAVHTQSGSGMWPFWVHAIPLALFVITQVVWTIGPAMYAILVTVLADQVSS